MEWIDCSEKLPDRPCRCIVFAPDGDSQTKDLVIEATHLGGSFTTGYYSNRVRGVTHWMPLPDPPKA